ncbi:MAG: hypothetical protein BGO82_10765 [Devosia sp. 67-54]|nr:MAG: hypothetical protein BGO82_10765 [Devosia sp. 67-54]
MIAAQGSLSGAARVLNIAQPALTHHTAELEQSLGVTLFERSSRGVELTDEGRLLLKHADIILDQVATAEAEFHRLAARARYPAVISLAITPSLTAIAAALIKKISERMPDLTLRIAGMNDRTAEAMLEEGQLDAVLRFSDWKRGGTPLVWDSLVLVTRPSATPVSTVAFRNLQLEKLLLPFVGNPLRRLMDDTALEVGVSLNIVAEIDGSAPRKEAVLAGLGSTVATWQSVARECTAGWLSAATIIDPPLRRLFVLHHRDGLNPDVLEVLRQEIEVLLSGPNAEPA